MSTPRSAVCEGSDLSSASYRTTDTNPGGQNRHSLRWLLLIACFLVGLQLVAIACCGHSRVGVICSDSIQASLGFACVFACVNVMRRSCGLARYTWFLLSFAFILWLGGQSLSLFVDLSNRHALDGIDGLVFFFSLIPIGILPLVDPMSKTRTFDRLHYLDVVQLTVTWIAGSLYFSAQAWSLQSAFRIGPFTWCREIAFGGLVAVMFLCRALLTGSRPVRSFFGQMALFLLLSGLADSYMLRPEGDLQPGGFFDLVWCGLLLFPILIAAQWQQQKDTLVPDVPSKFVSVSMEHVLPIVYPIISVLLLDHVDRAYPFLGPALMSTALITFAARSLIIQQRQTRSEAQLKIDIEERIRAEHNLRLSENKYRELFEHSPYGIYLSAIDGTLLEVNSALVTMLGYDSPQELLSQDFSAHIFQDPKERAEARKRCEQNGAVDVVQVNFRRKDGETIVVRLNGRPIRNGDGEALCFEVIVEDITERQKLERQFLQAQKMEAVGRLAGGVAHDFNNVLGVILGYAELLKPTLSSDQPRSRQVDEIEKAGKRAALLTKQLLAFSRQQVIQPAVLNLNSVVVEMELMLRRLIGEDVDLTIVKDPLLGCVRMDRSQVEQIVMNLAVNARDAMVQGGTLVISTGNTELDDAYARQHSFATPGRYVSLSVSDDGCGIPKEVQAHIFEPFFTTKRLGEGTGLGLSTVYGIVKQSEGYISVYSEVGSGTTFKIYLPRIDARPEIAAETVTFTPLPPGTETVLLVEDEPDLLELAEMCLKRRGYNVFSARDGASALDFAEKHPGEMNLLLTDLVMPGMSGCDLAKLLRQTQPQMKVLYMSGYTRDLVTKRGVLDLDVSLLEKPFTIDSLCRSVRQVLDLTSENAGVTLSRLHIEEQKADG
jgi:two-component system cell cycle sensor histidine kinase/response regulator CckA